MAAPYRDVRVAQRALVVARGERRSATTRGVYTAATGVSTLACGVLLGPVVALSALIIAALAYRVIWDPANEAAEQLAALPFPVTHDRDDAMAFLSSCHVLAAIVIVRDPDGVSDAIRALPAGLQARVAGREITVAGKLRTREQLARLLTTWGIAVHERHGIERVDVAWSRRSGPPMTL